MLVIEEENEKLKQHYRDVSLAGGETESQRISLLQFSRHEVDE